jgi:glycosyltransferase involved in cell wall biosynthesis
MSGSFERLPAALGPLPSSPLAQAGEARAAATSRDAPAPAVSIILPTYNRARFLPQAFASIRAQTWTDWELIVVDDGSTDNTRELVSELASGIRQPVKYLHQKNQGAYGARNTGLDHARGKYIAFFDSDDEWLPHHLADCVSGLEGNPEVDWVYGACRIVEHATGQTLAPSTFYADGRARRFLKLRRRRAGRLYIIEDPASAACMILRGLFCGLQNSVIRARLFAGYRFNTCCRNEAEDQIVVIRALAKGHAFAYYDNVHVIYRVHADNSSNAAQGQSLERRMAVQSAILRGFEEMRERVVLDRAAGRALSRRLASEYFWTFGYALLWQHGRRAEALQAFRRGLRLWPWDPRCWKTYLLARVRILWSRTPLARSS